MNLKILLRKTDQQVISSMITISHYRDKKIASTNYGTNVEFNEIYL